VRTELHIPDADAFYEAIVAANEGLTEAQSAAFLMRFALLLANQIGDQQVLLEAIDKAREMAAADTSA
jgi:Protein of unknown function (DUF2783)